MDKRERINTLSGQLREPNLMRLLLHLKALTLPLLAFGSLGANLPARAQTSSESARPYATLDRQNVTYRGPAVSAEKELSDGAAVIGIILPLKGVQQTEGKALLAAAQLAIEEEQASGPLADGRRLELVARDESGPWGQASMEILKLFEQDHALAILTSANGTSAHLAEQIANKISVPILTLASDPTTTEANVPWLFRLGASDTDQARAFCRQIYGDLRLRKVLLVEQADHDGRTGGTEFEKAANRINAPALLRFELTDSAETLESLRATLQKNQPDGVVVWSDAPLADGVLALVGNVRPSTRVFLCRKAAQLRTAGMDSGESFTIDSQTTDHAGNQNKFQQAYFARTGVNPGLGAIEVYQAVHTVAAALRTTGVNRVLLRDYLANGNKQHEPANLVRFDPAGNSLQEFAVVKLENAKP
jgi:branched-chain amino acid transport system substrate-binding protein